MRSHSVLMNNRLDVGFNGNTKKKVNKARTESKREKQTFAKGG